MLPLQRMLMLRIDRSFSVVKLNLKHKIIAHLAGRWSRKSFTDNKMRDLPSLMARRYFMRPRFFKKRLDRRIAAGDL
jgi:hypothetical protein